jgi:hypothetical protein
MPAIPTFTERPWFRVCWSFPLQDLTLPADPALFGRDLYLRVWIADPTAAAGWSATGSVRFRLLGVPADAVFADAFEPR